MPLEINRHARKFHIWTQSAIFGHKIPYLDTKFHIWTQNLIFGINDISSAFYSFFFIYYTGYWFLHCHQMLHQVEGMSLILNVSQGIPPAPANFPTCKNFSISGKDFKVMLDRNKQCAIGKCDSNGPSKSKAAANVSRDFEMPIWRP